MPYYREIENFMVTPQALEKHYGGRPAQAERQGGAYAETERRLFALPILRDRVVDAKEELSELENCGVDALKHSSTSLVRLLRPGIRLTPEEVHAAQLAYIRSRLLADEREVKRMHAALSTVAEDPYYLSLELRYFKNLTDAASAKRLNCDPTTVRRNRKRLVKTLALRLYGSEALNEV